MEKMKITIPKEDLPKPRIPVWKIKPEQTHKTEKYDVNKKRRKGKEELRKILKKGKPETDF